MLKKFQVKNFQSHKDTTIEFHPGLNVIRGTSDHGKTALIRALIWLARNRPTGEGFKNLDSGKDDIVEVSLEFDEHRISHIREKGKSKYLVDGEELKAHGAAVPDHVTEALNIRDYNIQEQLDRHFLILSSPGDVAKEFNRIVNLDEIDIVTQRINKLARDNDVRVKISEEKLHELEAQKSSLEFVPSLDNRVSKLEQLREKIRQKEVQKERLEDFLQKYIDLARRLRALAPMAKLEDKVSHNRNLAAKLADLRVRRNALDSLLWKLKDISDLKGVLKGVMGRSEEVKKYRGIANKLLDLQRKRLDLITMREDLEDIQADLVSAGDEWAKKRARFKDLIEKAGTCPLCLSELGKEEIERLVKAI